MKITDKKENKKINSFIFLGTLLIIIYPPENDYVKYSLL